MVLSENKVGCFGDFSLYTPVTDEDWIGYHKIRRESLFDRINVPYDPNHPSLTNENNYHFGFYYKKRLIGTLQIEDLGNHTCSIRTIAITESQRNKGFGSVLLKMAEAEALKIGAAIIHLHGSPEAKSFYLKNGYSEMEFPNDTSINPKTIDFGKYLFKAKNS